MKKKIHKEEKKKKEKEKKKNHITRPVSVSQSLYAINIAR